MYFCYTALIHGRIQIIFLVLKLKLFLGFFALDKPICSKQIVSIKHFYL